MIVVDASVIIDLLVGGERGDCAALALDDHDAIFAPNLLHVECTSALWRLERTGVLATNDSNAHIRSLAAMPVRLVGTDVLVERAWHHRQASRIADAFYLACAELLELPLLTSDRRLGRSATCVDVRVV